MGSFNEVCALSGLDIQPGTPVKVLFLTQNPYIKSDQHLSHRGCYSTDHWFVRTPPIDGVYDDYGRAAFKESPITDLITELFQKDMIEKPFGHNQYHAPPVTKGQGIHHLMAAAYEGRLSVRDYGGRPKIPKRFPTWKRVHAILRKAGLKIMDHEDKEGFNAQNVKRGVVCVGYNKYGNITKTLMKAERALRDRYDCKVVYQWPDRKDEPSLLVTAKGAFENPEILFKCHEEDYKRALTTHPQMRGHYARQLPVMMVMVRTDVWESFCKVAHDRAWHPTKSVDEICSEIKKVMRAKDDSPFGDIDARMMREALFHGSLPFQMAPHQHLIAVSEKDEFPQLEELVRGCAEVSRIESIMNNLSMSWHVPTLGGQCPEWEMRAKLLQGQIDICNKELRQEEEESDDEDLVDEDIVDDSDSEVQE